MLRQAEPTAHLYRFLFHASVKAVSFVSLKPCMRCVNCLGCVVGRRNTPLTFSGLTGLPPISWSTCCLNRRPPSRRALRYIAAAKVSKWAGLDHSEKVLQRAIVRSSFKSMRRKEEARGLLIFDEKYPDRDKSWRMTRKGKAGGWEECFTSPASKDIFNELAYDTLFGLGYVQDERW